MKERGMIFNSEMVRAILDGRKTQTRRIMKVQPESNQLGLLLITDSTKHSDIGKYHWAESNATGNHVRSKLFSSPFGAVGERIWVRETWATLGNEEGCYVDWEDNLCKGDERSAARIYRASCEQRPGDYGLWSIPDDAYWKPHTKEHKFEGAWRPSIHMPRWASRILLEITDVRVERLNAISEEDARAEGIIDGGCLNCGEPEPCGCANPEPDATDAFAYLWQSIYGQDNWNANPWVWVIEFKRVEGGAA
ncbi:TPA: hypothetical protein ACYU8D_003987 [Klebsiella pneumoniae]|uniref:Morphogenetic protein n=4 Tax=Klebsiella pneumoniae complex TaxID=3390273 RepID=A0A422ZHT1_KLEPN|nr:MULTISPECIES: hypothetical protein [Klebsiella]RDB00620.1 hypothetical protein DVB85_10375 [Klebsiella oxytoca]HBQ8853699.1 hypothetical protein [Klebsiella variicola subsp. variicola]HBV4138377.1 hypothetical protein [Klebsiella quasipneumoniae]AXT65662.1 hypothetical protein CN260_10290 [Klebsiella pneumoniae]AYC85069.1 hypothetical protein CJ257_19660 [Klebsiella pneumoniae]